MNWVIDMKKMGLILLLLGFLSFIGAFGCLIIYGGMFNINVSQNIIWLLFIFFIVLTIITIPLGIILLFIDKYRKRKEIVKTFSKAKTEPIILTPHHMISHKTVEHKTIKSNNTKRNRNVKRKSKPVKKTKQRYRKSVKKKVKVSKKKTKSRKK